MHYHWVKDMLLHMGLVNVVYIRLGLDIGFVIFVRDNFCFLPNFVFPIWGNVP
jgi:hypothetical protein